MSQNETRLSVCLGLACMFAGIWITDAQALSALALPFGDLIMRFMSLVIYLVFFVAAFFVEKRARGKADGSCSDTAKRHVVDGSQKFLFIASLGAIVCYCIGSFLILGTERLGPFDISDSPVLGCIALFLMKTIGAPLSIGLVCLFADLERDSVVRVATTGLLGAFVIQAVAAWCLQAGLFDSFIAFVMGSAMILIAWVCGSLVPIRLRTVRHTKREVQPQHKGVFTIRRSFSRFITKDLLIGIVIASVMLGYLRSGLTTYDPHTLPAVVLAFILLAGIVRFGPNIGLGELFRAAIVCTAAGFLLGPILSVILVNATDILCGIGSALFEIVIWMIAVWAARNCIESLLAAAATRLAVVFGHFLGAVIVQVALLFFGSDPLAQQTSSFVIVFAYIIMLLGLYGNPTIRPLFMLRSYDELDGASNDKAPDAGVPPDIQSDEDEEEGPIERADHYWKGPCDYIAEIYDLTARETEILEQLARGRNLGFMEEKFVLSRNTIKMHIKHIYAKLDVHSKQEVIDLVEEARRIL